MGKAKDEEIHATEAFTYADVASTRWNHLWNHRTKAPVRVLIMGSSLKFAHSTNGDKFRAHAGQVRIRRIRRQLDR